MERNQIIKNLAKSKISYQKIAKQFNISWQRVHQIVTGYKSPSHIRYEKTRHRDKNEYLKKYQARLRRKIIEHYSGNSPKCMNCGYDVFEALCLDHTNNDGNIWRKKRKSRSPLSLYIKIRKENYPTDYQVLCFNCNWLKYKNYRVFLRQKERRDKSLRKKIN